jgi:acetyl esterase/lipase
MKRREFLLASGVGFAVMAVWLGLVIRAFAQPTPAPVATALPQPAREIPLYPGAAPGSEKWDWSERSVTTATGLPMVQDVVRPVLLHYPAERDKAVGTAMIVAPGGGFRTLMMSYEGLDIARRLNAMGVDAFVLKYRLLYTGPGAPSRPASGASGAGRPKAFSLTGAYKAQAGQDLIALAVDDGRQAVRLVRERAGEFGVRPDRVGMMGFSAGGLVTSEALFGPAATRPDFAAVIYGVGEIRETPSPAPPLFLAVAADDTLAVGRTVEHFTAYRKSKGSAELHVFQMGAHGFVNKGGGADHFMDRLEEWLVANKLLVKSPTGIRLAPKPVDQMAERRARPQPTVPSNYTEMAFVETAVEPTLTPE